MTLHLQCTVFGCTQVNSAPEASYMPIIDGDNPGDASETSSAPVPCLNELSTDIKATLLQRLRVLEDETIVHFQQLERQLACADTSCTTVGSSIASPASVVPHCTAGLCKRGMRTMSFVGCRLGMVRCPGDRGMSRKGTWGCM